MGSRKGPQDPFGLRRPLIEKSNNTNPPMTLKEDPMECPLLTSKDDQKEPSTERESKQTPVFKIKYHFLPSRRSPRNNPSSVLILLSSPLSFEGKDRRNKLLTKSRLNEILSGAPWTNHHQGREATSPCILNSRCDIMGATSDCFCSCVAYKRKL